MDEFDANESLQSYANREDRTEQEAIELNRKLRDLKEMADRQLALTQADGGNKRKIGEVVEGARIVCEEQGTVTGSEFVVMGEVLRSCAKVELSHLKRYNHGGVLLNDDRFAETPEIGHLSRDDYANDPLVHRVTAEQFRAMINRFPNIEEPPDDEDDDENDREPPKKKQKKERVKQVPAPVREIPGQTVEQANEKREESMQKEIDHVMTELRKACKKSSTRLVNYYRFVVDPRSFAKTIENMFYISFLVSDKQVKLSVDEGSGMPEIERIHNQKGDDEPENESDKVQCISKLDQVTWKKLVKRLKITDRMFERRNKETDGAG